MNTDVKQGDLFPETQVSLLFSEEDMKKMKEDRPKHMPELEKQFYIEEGFLDVEKYYFQENWTRVRFMFLMYNKLPY